MSVCRLLEDYQQLGAEILLLLNLQLSRGSFDIPVVDELHTYLDDYGVPFVLHFANTYLQSENGKTDLAFIMSILQNEIEEPKNCFQSRRICPCRHQARQECDALIDLSFRMLLAIVEEVKTGAEEMEQENMWGN